MESGELNHSETPWEWHCTIMGLTFMHPLDAPDHSSERFRGWELLPSACMQIPLREDAGEKQKRAKKQTKRIS